MTDDLTNRIAHVISRCYHDDPWAVAVAVVEELGLRRQTVRTGRHHRTIGFVYSTRVERDTDAPAPPAR
jgi:hypothetical protein